MARVKAVIPRSVRRDGYAVLNAEDDLVLGMRDEIDCNIALFSMDEENEHVRRHASRGGMACVYENGWVTILKGEWKIRIERGIDIPITYGGKAPFMMKNVLAATLAAYILHNVSVEDLRAGLATFSPTPAQAPGRLNMIEVGNFSVLVDFAHNAAGYRGLGEFIGNLSFDRVIGVVGGVGDRRDEDIIEIGRLAAPIFDKIYVREDEDRRGRSEGEINELVVQGVREVDQDVPVEICDSQIEAIETALSSAEAGELVVIFADKVAKTLEMVGKYREEIAA